MKRILPLVLPAIATFFFGCGAEKTPPSRTGGEGSPYSLVAPVGSVLVATMVPTEGNSAGGTVTFTRTEQGVMVEAKITGLTPGEHGIHIHEFGDLRAPDGTETGGHYDPEGVPHGLPPHEPRHAGDLGNITAGADGEARMELLVTNITLDDDRAPIVGRGVIIHAKPDDGGQPTGNAGARVAQGVIGYANPGD